MEEDREENGNIGDDIVIKKEEDLHEKIMYDSSEDMKQMRLINADYRLHCLIKEELDINEELTEYFEKKSVNSSEALSKEITNLMEKEPEKNLRRNESVQLENKVKHINEREKKYVKLSKRESNWTFQEKQLLIEQLKIYVKKIENKNVDCKTNTEKDECWQLIAKIFAVNGFKRDKKKIKEQWKRMKLNAKNNISLYNKYRSGSGPPRKIPDDIDYEIQLLIPTDSTEDVSNLDSDRVISTSTSVEFQPSTLPQSADDGFSTVELQPENSTKTSSVQTNLIDPTSTCTSPLPQPPQSVSCSKNISQTNKTFQSHENSKFVKSNRRQKNSKPESSVSTYKEKCLEIYERKIRMQMRHAKELHNIRKRWEEKIYKLKYETLKKELEKLDT